MIEQEFQRRCYQISPRDIAYLKFILESYDGLCFLRALASRLGIVEIAWPPSRSAAVAALLAALAEEIKLAPVPQPDDYRPL